MAGEVAALDVAYGRCSGRRTGKDVPQVPLAEYQDAVSELGSHGQDDAASLESMDLLADIITTDH